jgi:UDP-glucose:(heptosyl)LPS alpha-1,3-glucosyltransferase
VRIAVISPSVDRQHGTERAVAELIERLPAVHHDQIHLHAQSVKDVNLKPEIPRKDTGQNGGIVWHRVRTFPGPHLVQFLGWLLMNRWARRTPKSDCGEAPEIVFSPGINALDADVILVHAVFHRVAELQRSHHLGGLRGLHRKLYYALLCRLERKIYRNPRVTLAAVSTHTAKQLASYFGREDVTVIPNGVDGDYFSPAAIAPMRAQSRQAIKCSPSDFVLLLIGNDWRNKGLPTLLQALACCTDLPVRLLVVGQDEQPPFRAETQNLGIADRVAFFAPVSDVRNFYAAADVLVAPSLEDSFNLPALEAMSCGLPVIVSSHAGISDWLTHEQDSIVLADPENVDNLAEAIRTLASDSSRRHAIATKASSTATKFSWDAHVNAVRELMVRAAEEKRAASANANSLA